MSTKPILFFTVIIMGLISCNNKVKTNDMRDMEFKQANIVSTTNDTAKIVKTEEEWKKELTPEQFYILRQKGTERPFTGALLHNTDEGFYTCAACGNKLFTSDQKFDSHCGWPSFDNQVEGAINMTKDTTHGMIRTEITCAKCDGHLGHIFDDGPTETGMRYCVNSISIDFKKDSSTTSK